MTKSNNPQSYNISSIFMFWVLNYLYKWVGNLGYTLACDGWAWGKAKPNSSNMSRVLGFCWFGSTQWKIWCKCVKTIYTTKVAKGHPGHDHLPFQNGKSSKLFSSIPMISTTIWWWCCRCRKCWGWNSKGFSQIEGSCPIAQTFMSLLICGGIS